MEDAVGALCGFTVGVVVAGTGLVDVVLDDGGVYHGEGRDPESGDDTVDRREGDLLLAEERHQDLIDEGQENDDGDGVEVLHQIVGNAVSGHLSALGDEVIRKLAYLIGISLLSIIHSYAELTVNDPINGVEAENLASNKRTLDFLNKVVVPAQHSSLAQSSLVRGLRAIHLARLDHQPHNAESISNDRALRWSNNIDLATEHKHQRTDEKDTETQ